ncbi:MAG: amino acid carrier protein, partial [bacterium]|nr:amino acid carrier protein [bacterium]
ATMYRKKDSHGVEQGGPMYYLEVGLGKWAKPLAVMFAACGMLGCLSLFQINQLAGLLDTDYSFDRLTLGIICMVLVGAVIIGGIKRVGRVSAKVVPAMCLLYFFSALAIVLYNYAAVPSILMSIFENAFGGSAVVGGAAGVGLREVMRTGIQRAAFSNEAGVGTAPMAHGAAKTKEPIREGLIAMLGPFLDTNIVCTLTALVILGSGVLKGELGGTSEAVVVTAEAFTMAMGQFGRYILTLVITLFSISTMISYSYYSLKCAKYLFGDKWGGRYVWVYLLSLPMAAVITQDTVVNIIDTCFALMAVPTLVGAILLSPKVVTEIKSYFLRMKI